MSELQLILNRKKVRLNLVKWFLFWTS